MRLLDGHKNRDEFYDEYAEELDIISDGNYCEIMGWTFSQLDEEKERFPYRVFLHKNWKSWENEDMMKRTKKR